MRPINLIPEEERGGARRPMRGGPLAYIVLGSLLAALVAVTVLVVTDNQISDSKEEAVVLKSEIAAAEARVSESAAYTQFHQVTEQRATTIANLANSRFGWEKVMRQLSLIIPSDVSLTNLTGTVKPEVSVNGAASISLREAVPGPALQMTGCAAGQEAVAGFVSSLKEIDGVTRVGMQVSELASGGSGEGGGSVSASGTCGKGTAQFQIVVAFDAAPIPTTGAEGGETEVAAAPTTTATETATSTESSSESESSTESGGE
jgi:Tfp pilus assembly protein PilN